MVGSLINSSFTLFQLALFSYPNLCFIDFCIEIEKYSNISKTKFDIEDLNDITRAKMFIKYKGNEYEAWDVAVGFEEVLLNVRKGHEKEDIEENGFECHQIDQYTRWINRWIKKEEIEDIRIEETSVYEEFLNKYGN